MSIYIIYIILYNYIYIPCSVTPCLSVLLLPLVCPWESNLKEVQDPRIQLLFRDVIPNGGYVWGWLCQTKHGHEAAWKSCSRIWVWKMMFLTSGFCLHHFQVLTHSPYYCSISNYDQFMDSGIFPIIPNCSQLFPNMDSGIYIYYSNYSGIIIGIGVVYSQFIQPLHPRLGLETPQEISARDCWWVKHCGFPTYFFSLKQSIDDQVSMELPSQIPPIPWSIDGEIPNSHPILPYNSHEY